MIDGPTASELADRIRRGDRSPVEVVETTLERIASLDEEVNAFVTVDEEGARERAREAERAVSAGERLGPLHGVPVAIKDLTPVAGIRTTFGAAPFAEYVPDRSAAVVRRLEAAGAIVVGKTNTPAFGHKGTTDNDLVGPTRNPFDLQTNAGGSSGGSGAAVAAGMVPIAEGSDGGGSVRIPASFCGIVGLKPTFRRIPRTGRPNGFAGHSPFLHHGPMARTVEDAALMMDVIAGPHPDDPLSLPARDGSYRAATRDPVDGLDVAYTPDFGVFPVDRRVRAVVDDALEALEPAVGRLERVSVEFPPLEEVQGSWTTLRSVQHAMLATTSAEAYGIDMLAALDDLPAQYVESLIRPGLERSAIDYRLADLTRTDVFDAVQSILADYDLLVGPTLGVPAFANGEVGPETIDGQAIDPYIGWRPTFPFNLSGHPAASVPAGRTDRGLPVGLQVVGPRFREDLVLAVSAALERVRPWRESYDDVLQ